MDWSYFRSIVLNGLVHVLDHSIFREGHTMIGRLMLSIKEQTSRSTISKVYPVYGKQSVVLKIVSLQYLWVIPRLKDLLVHNSSMLLKSINPNLDLIFPFV